MALANSSPDTLPDDLLADVAHWRARGLSWEDTAAKVQRQPAELRQAARKDPRFRHELAYANREFKQETEAQALQALRVQMKSDDPRAALTAAKSVLTYLTRKRAERIKFKIACIRGEVAPTRSTEPPRPPSPEEAERAAEQWVQSRGEVYLWGGCHKLHRTEPDETDTRLYLRPDHSIPGRVIFWGQVRERLGCDPIKGPFLKPPGCRPPACPHVTDTPAPPG
jgi:hypothetical protein